MTGEVSAPSPAIIIRGATLYAPEPRGAMDLVCLGGRIAQLSAAGGAELGALIRALDANHIEHVVIDANDAVVFPGVIDGHEHLIGGSGEKGFATLTPEIALSELIVGGITTVVGCLGVDTTTRTPTALLARVKGLREEGITAYMYSGGYDVPPRTLTGSVRNDLILIEEVIGAGEIAIADARSTQPTLPELARLVADAYVGGMLSGKSGVSHFHVGPGREGLAMLRKLVENHEIRPEWLYPTHIERTETLLDEAIALTRLGASVDMDVMDEDFQQWFAYYLAHDGDPSRLTATSDAAICAPATLYAQIRKLILSQKATPETALALVTANPARILRLPRKGRVAVGADADLIIAEKSDWQIREVIAGGRRLMRDGKVINGPKSMDASNRRIELYGKKAPPQ